MKNKLYIILAGLLLTMTSCDNWLTLAPEDGVTREEFWQTKEQVNAAVIGCYASLLDGPVTKMFLWGELRGDMIDNGVRINNTYSQVLDGEISAENYLVNWADFYTTINNCNTVLKFAPTVRSIDGTFTLKKEKEYEAEALTLRAMMYFYLVRSFGDVPLVREASVSDDQNYSIAKTSGSVILDSCIADLKLAIQQAPLSYSTLSENKSRISTWSARALLADIYLWKEQYAECNQLCQEIIVSNRYNLIPTEKIELPIEEGGFAIDTVTVANEGDAETMFVNTYVNGNSIESIFEIPFTNLKNNPFYSLLAPSVNQLKPKSDVLEGGIFPDPLYLAASSATDIRGNGCSYRMNVVWKYVGLGRSSAARSSTDYTSPWLVYKYSDVLLMKAEALNELGLKTTTNDSKRSAYYEQSIKLVNQVREARNAVQTPDYEFNPEDMDGKMLEKAIFQERGREFTFEGKRWYDVLRFAKRDNYAGTNIYYLLNMAISSANPVKLQSILAKYRDPQHNSHYWPIYYQELETNKELVQNPFYAK